MKTILTILVCTIFCNQIISQQLSFPTADGIGKFTKGGRGTTSIPTTVYFVTNLNDDGLIGSLRYAINQTAAYRTIVFNVSGTIHLIATLSIKANTTIAGQTAPGDGICLADYTVSLGGNNIIVRYLRFRLGDKNELKTNPSGCGVPIAPFTATCMPLNGSGGNDAFGGTGRKNIMIDHCTMSWSNDESCSIYSGDSTTVQWCMMSEPLNYAYHFETGDADFEHHGYGGIWGGRKATFHHNLLAHCQGRACRFDGSRNLDGGTTVGKENCDFANNVIYNWGGYNVNGGEGGNYNILNNYYKYGPSTGTSVKSMVINPFATSPLPYGKYYLSGNYVDGNTTVTNNNWLGAKMDGGSLADTIQSKVAAAFSSFPSINLQSSLDAYNAVIGSVGASIPARDTLDTRIINNVKNRTGKIIDCQGGYPHATSYATTVNAWPTLIQGTAALDDDYDGMPNWWETREGLNPTTSTDRNTLTIAGYTVLEKYLYSIPAWNAHAAFVSITATKLNTTTARINFITDWTKDGFKYGLFRSNDSLGTYTKVAEISSYIDYYNLTVDDATLPLTTVYYKVGSYKIGFTPDTLYSSIVKITGIITPVKLSSYEVKKIDQNSAANNNRIVIENAWATATEINTSYFNIQSSNDARSFETVGTIAAKGKGSYSYTNSITVYHSPFIIYYRLEIVDKDGSKTYSEIKQLAINDKQQAISIFPNPAKNSFAINHSIAEKNATVQIINEAGKICFQMKVKQGNTITVVNTDKLAKGNYTVIFINGETKVNNVVIIL